MLPAVMLPPPLRNARRLMATIAALALGSSTLALAAGPPCRPCAGLVTDDPLAAVTRLGEGPELRDGQRLYLAWSAELDGTADSGIATAVDASGATSWSILRVRTPSPLTERLSELTSELEDVARLARASTGRAHFQLEWAAPESHLPDPKDFAFLVKRAAVAVTGANPDALVVVGPVPPAPAWIRAFYAEDVAAYVDGMVLSDLGESPLEAAVATLLEVDPGKPVVVQRPFPEEPTKALARAAEDASRGVAVTLFSTREPSVERLRPLRILAREFAGDLSYDPTSAPSTPGRAWTFVRGEDLGLRVIVEGEAGSSRTSLHFADAQLKSPERIDPETSEPSIVFGQTRTQSGLLVPLDDPAPVEVLRLARMTAAEMEGVEEEVLVADERQIPVEEILRRLQAFEDDQARRLEHYRAQNRMNLRFRIGNGASAVDVAFEGDFFFRQGEGFDWSWRDLYFNGVRWTGKKLPELPLIQPEKAAVLPLEITFTKQYRYRLRGTGEALGRDCWIVDFEPFERSEGETLWQGTVWIDRETSARVRTRALQLGLEGDVLSNEETLEFSPVDASGQPTEWSRDAFVLPLRTTGQQLLSVLNTSTLVERETRLTDVEINGTGFATQREAVLASDVTMVRDTDAGLRYLVKDGDGERIVKEDFDLDRLAMAGGFFYDDTADFPVPLVGINYFSLDWRGTGNQLNFLFAGPLLVANLAEPTLFGSRWDAGLSAFGFFLPLEDELYRDGRVVPAETVESANARLAFFLGHPIGNFAKLDFTAAAAYRTFGEAEDTADGFVLPDDTLTLSLSPELTYTRSGWRFRVGGGWFHRTDWSFWGLPGNEDFDPAQEDYLRWQASLAKTWWLPKFTQLGLELEVLDGQDLDRFSKYDFGTFGDADVSGYPGGLVRAESAHGLHLNYGLNLGDVMQVEVEADAVWATDEATGLDDELLAGVGLEGTLIGPWETIVNFEIGHGVAGPGDGYSARVVFLKLFPEDFKLFGRKKKRGGD